MDKNVEFSLLFDCYGKLLTDKQRDIMDLYYNLDYSLGEIADDLNISRQGVRDSLKRSEAILVEAEEKLGFIKQIDFLKNELNQIAQKANAAAISDNIETMKKTLQDIENKAKLICT